MTDESAPIVARREIGRSGIEVSALSFGSMRMLEKGLDVGAWQTLFEEFRAQGVTTFHSSDEYESFSCFTDAARQMHRSHSQGAVEHIVKLAEPSFGHDRFDPTRLGERIDTYLNALGVERIEVVQWMWRGDLKDEEGRLKASKAQLPDLKVAFNKLRQAGKIGTIATFPYTIGCAELLMDEDWNQGFSLYVNPLELEMLPFVERAAKAGRGTVAIRPLAAGRAATENMPASSALAWALAKPGVCTGVVSFSSVQHLHELLGAFH